MNKRCSLTIKHLGGLVTQHVILIKLQHQSFLLFEELIRNQKHNPGDLKDMTFKDCKKNFKPLSIQFLQLKSFGVIKNYGN